MALARHNRPADRVPFAPAGRPAPFPSVDRAKLSGPTCNSSDILLFPLLFGCGSPQPSCQPSFWSPAGPDLPGPGIKLTLTNGRMPTLGVDRNLFCRSIEWTSFDHSRALWGREMSTN